MRMANPEQRQSVEELVYRSCLALDERDWKGFLELCDDEFRYTITAYSPEIRKDMVWLDHDRKGMDTLLTNLPRHNSDHSPITRHVTVYTVDLDAAQGQASVVSALQVFRTQLDGGASELFAVGRFHDTVKLNGSRPKLARRVVKLDTRLLGYGYHVPF
jgi:methanesulfonate monooxygenase small subunit